MAYSGIQMFMDKLNQLINSNHIPSINKPEIICHRPLFQWLYDELASIIQTLFIHQHQDLQQLNDLKQRFIHAAEAAEYNVDLFLSDVHIRNNGNFQIYEDFKRSRHRDDGRRSFKFVADMFLSCVHIRNNGSGDFQLSIKLDDVRRSLMSVQVKLMNMNIDSKKILDSSPRPQTTINQSAAAAQSSISRGSKKLMDEINLYVGIDRDAELIRDKLVEDQKKLDVVSIVGMGGIGKTTLATKVFNDAYVKHHFYVRVWVTVSQTYDKHAVLVQILESIRGQLDLEKASDSRLRELVHKNLMGKRYLIVIDDIWDIETWDNLKVFFPHDNNGSRILLTSCLTEVAKHACSNGLIHHLGYLNKEKSWELLCQKVFHGNECPEWSIEPGMQIVENCHGLPLAVVVIAGVLAKEAWSKTFWEEISYKMGSYLVGDKNGCLEILGLSYNHLPLHLRECFLYLGGFPEDYMFRKRELIWLWMAEGFIQQDGIRRLEDIAEGYLMDLIDRNLVIVAHRSKSNGGVKACKVHDLIRELCLKKANEEQFILNIERLTGSSELNKVKNPPYRPERMFTARSFIIPSAQNYRSFLFFGYYFRSLRDDIEAFAFPSAQNCRSVLVFGYIRSLGNEIAKHFQYSFVLLRVLNLQKCELNDIPKGMELLVHLRYLAICIEADFPDSICKLWNLQTLIYLTDSRIIDLPSNISDLVNLRHLRTSYYFVLDYIERPMKNLQTISKVELGYRVVDNLQKCFPYIKQLTCRITMSEKKRDFQSLIYLENLNLTTNIYPRRVKSITFPATLISLTLRECYLPWSEMSIIIQSLPNLQVLKLNLNAFKGRCWNTDGLEFPQLQFLRLHLLDIREWEANSRSFPCLKQLQIISCWNLEKIPLEIGEIPTLELIQIKKCRRCVGESVRRIEEDQHDNWGNYSLKIDI